MEGGVGRELETPAYPIRFVIRDNFTAFIYQAEPQIPFSYFQTIHS